MLLRGGLLTAWRIFTVPMTKWVDTVSIGKDFTRDALLGRNPLRLYFAQVSPSFLDFRSLMPFT